MGASADAIFPQPRPILAVHLGDMLDEPLVQCREQGVQGHLFGALETMGCLHYGGQYAVVFGSMLDKADEAGLFHEVLLAGEMHAGEVDELVEQVADFFAAGAAIERQTQVIDRVHEDAMLIVHGANADGAGMVPGEKSHMSLRK